MTVFRYQDNEGRGPFKPGMTERWLVDHGSKPVGLINELGVWRVRLAMETFVRKHQEIHNFGFGCESLDDIFRWFTPSERRTLDRLGYQLVAMLADDLVARNPNEVLFARRRPLSRRAVILAIE